MNGADRTLLALVVCPPAAALVVLAVGLVISPTPTQPIRSQPASTRCFPPGTVLPYRQDFLGNRHPVFKGCPDYRMNEGMET
jgi:hypothetical protein